MAFKRIESQPSVPVKSPMQQRLDQLFSLFHRNGSVQLEITEDAKYPAFAQGLCVLNYAFGRVEVKKGLVQLLRQDELDFVLLHELAHIVENHLFWQTVVDLPQNTLNALTPYDQSARDVNLLVHALKAVCVVTGNLPPEASISKAQEIGADVQAICLTRNLNAAISTLTKLVDNDLDQPSHLWEYLGIKLPIMTMKERLDEIQRCLQQLNVYGFRPFYLR